MQPPKPQLGQFVSDMMKVAGSAVGIAASFRESGREHLNRKGTRMASQMDLATHEEVRVLKAMVAESRLKQETLEKELETLKTELKKPTPKKPSTKKKNAS